MISNTDVHCLTVSLIHPRCVGPITAYTEDTFEAEDDQALSSSSCLSEAVAQLDAQRQKLATTLAAKKLELARKKKKDQVALEISRPALPGCMLMNYLFCFTSPFLSQT